MTETTGNRRPIDELLVALDDALTTQRFVKLTLGKPRRGVTTTLLHRPRR
jgi:hypothetical protein